MTTFNEQTGTNNPFNSFDVGSSSTPSLADIDGDGDLDAVVGASDGTLKYYENTGSATAPSYVEQTGTNNPFNGFDVGFYSAPTLVDIDGDGDLDAVVGASDGTLKYYENTGSATAPSYVQQTGTNNPFNGINVGSSSAPTFADIDGDGDLDAVVGEYYGTLKYYENTGSATAPSYVEQIGTNNPFNGINVGLYSSPTLVDIDGDGDLDAIVGSFYSTLKYYENTGSATAPSYVEQTGTNNPFNGFDVGSSSAPTLADVDGDGDLDAVVGGNLGTLSYLQNDTPLPPTNVAPVAVDDGFLSEPNFNQQTGTDNPFNGIDVGNFSHPTLADIDGDGDLDTVVGESDGTLKYYENTGSATAPSYVEQTGTNNPFNGFDVGSFSAPTFADVDGDGDLDAVVGEFYGNLKYYENTGSATAPSYVEQTGTNNPFNGINVGLYSSPTLVDIDGDGDLDAVVGEVFGTLKYYENTGSATAPSYVEQTGTNNPFNGINVGSFTAPTFADVDGDGDLDAVVGNNFGTLKYYENTGSATAPSYVEQTGTNNPFNGINVSLYSAPTLVDIDGDGDLDAIVGSFYGTLNYFENEPVVTPDPAFTTDEDTAFTTGNVLANDSDVDGDTLTVTSIDTTGTLGTVTDNGDGTFSYDPNGQFESLNDGETATDTFSYTVSDGNGGTDTATVTVTINGVNDNVAPVAVDDSATTDEDVAVSIDVLANDTDADNDPLTIDSFTQATNGTVTLDDNGTPGDATDDLLVYTPDANFNGSDSFTYTTTDGTVTDTATVNVTVNSVNDAPTVANAIPDQTTLEDGFFSFQIPANTFADVDAGDSLTYTATLADGTSLPTWLSFDAATGTFSGTPDDPDVGTISLKVTATDTSNASVEDTFDLTVTAVNDDPVAGDDVASTNQNTPVTLLAADLLANDTDVDSTTLTITGVDNAVNGSVSLDSNGDVLFTPTIGFSGDASFNYTVSDGDGGTDVGMVTVAVGVNLSGTNNDDTLSGTAGDDIINGLNGQDTISGNAGNDNLVGGNGDDSLYGELGDDTLIGGNGQDLLYGDGGNDYLEGDNGDDQLNGGDGNDTLIGGNGQDFLVGGAGDDFLNGGKGDDNLTGGIGSDIFLLEKAAGRDTITDFSLGQSDQIALSGINFNQLSFSGDEIRLGNQTLAVLTGFDTTTLTQNDFISV